MMRTNGSATKYPLANLYHNQPEIDTVSNRTRGGDVSEICFGNIRFFLAAGGFGIRGLWRIFADVFLIRWLKLAVQIAGN